MIFHAPPAFAPWAISRGRLALFDGGAQAFHRHRPINELRVAEEVGKGLGDGIDWDLKASDHMVFDALTQIALGKPHHAHRGIGLHRRPVASADGHPDAARHLIGQAMKDERGHQSDHALGDAYRRLGEDLVLLDLGSTLLVNPARDTFDFPGLDGARDRLRADPSFTQFLRAHHAPAVEQISELDPLRIFSGRHVTNPLIDCRFIRGFVTSHLGDDRARLPIRRL